MWFPVLPTQRAMPSSPPAESDPPFTASQHLCPAFRRPVLTTCLTLPDSLLHAHLHGPTRPVLESYGAHPNYTTPHNKSDSHTELFKRSEVKACFKNLSPSILPDFHMGLCVWRLQQNSYGEAGGPRPSIHWGLKSFGFLRMLLLIPKTQTPWHMSAKSGCMCVSNAHSAKSFLSVTALEIRWNGMWETACRNLQRRHSVGARRVLGHCGEVKPESETLSCHSEKRGQL